MGWKKRFGKKKEGKLNVDGMMKLYFIVKEKMSQPATMSISAKDFKRMTGLSLPDEANLVWFTPSSQFGRPVLYPDGRYELPGELFLKMIERAGEFCCG